MREQPPLRSILARLRWHLPQPRQQSLSQIAQALRTVAELPETQQASAFSNLIYAIRNLPDGQPKLDLLAHALRVVAELVESQQANPWGGADFPDRC